MYKRQAVYCGELPDLASKTHHTLLSADVSASKNSQETLRELGKAWQFPLWYGTNLDALHDCLTDPDWQAKKKIILKITGLDTLKNSHPEAFSTLNEVLRSAAAIRSAATHPPVSYTPLDVNKRQSFGYSSLPQVKRVWAMATSSCLLR